MVETLRTFVELNRDLIFFVYGLSFFMLGLAITLQSRQSSRLDLARDVSWLGAFGIAHGLHEWGEYFIPIQSAYLSPAAIANLQGLRLILLAVSFSFLVEFGSRLLRPHPSAQIISYINITLFFSWLLVAFIPLRLFAQFDSWLHVADAIARYAIGLPGGLLAGYALRRQTKDRIEPLQLPHIVRSLRIVGLSLVLYGLLGGLLPPPVPFFPGSILNSQTFEAALIIPPSVIRSLLGLIMAVFTIRALEVFDVELNRRLEAMEQQQILQVEHRRIARDLHDGAIQKVYTAGLVVESLEQHLQSTDVARSRYQRAVNALNDAIHDLRSNLRELSPTPSDLSLVDRLREVTGDPRFRSFLDIDYQVNIASQPQMDPLRIDHVTAIVTEALTNVVRHARASRATVFVEASDDQLQVLIVDNGTGFPAETHHGFGIRNMRDRARLLDGELELSEHDSGGLQVRLTAPMDPTI